MKNTTVDDIICQLFLMHSKYTEGRCLTSKTNHGFVQFHLAGKNRFASEKKSVSFLVWCDHDKRRNTLASTSLLLYISAMLGLDCQFLYPSFFLYPFPWQTQQLCLGSLNHSKATQVINPCLKICRAHSTVPGVLLFVCLSKEIRRWKDRDQNEFWGNEKANQNS